MKIPIISVIQFSPTRYRVNNSIDIDIFEFCGVPLNTLENSNCSSLNNGAQQAF
jgi:hypothetical protein